MGTLRRSQQMNLQATKAYHKILFLVLIREDLFSFNQNTVGNDIIRIQLCNNLRGMLQEMNIALIILRRPRMKYFFFFQKYFKFYIMFYFNNITSLSSFTRQVQMLKNFSLPAEGREAWRTFLHRAFVLRNVKDTTITVAATTTGD